MRLQLANGTQSSRKNEKQLNAAYYISCYVLSSPELLRLDSLVDINIETYGMDKLYVLKYRISEQLKRIRFLSKNEPNIYRRRVENGLYCISFFIKRKYNYTIDLLNSCGMKQMPISVLHDTLSFQTKNLGYRYGSRGLFCYLSFSDNFCI